jgi:hypothetical protein
VIPGARDRALDDRRRDLRRGIADLYLELRGPGTTPGRRADIMGLLSGLEAALVRHRGAGTAEPKEERSR